MYKNAFSCKKCPGNSGEDGCPCWIELICTNDQTGETKTEKGCYFQLMPKLMLEVVKAANQSTEQASKVNNNLMSGLVDMGNSLMQRLEGPTFLEDYNNATSK